MECHFSVSISVHSAIHFFLYYILILFRIGGISQFNYILILCQADDGWDLEKLKCFRKKYFLLVRQNYFWILCLGSYLFFLTHSSSNSVRLFLKERFRIMLKACLCQDQFPLFTLMGIKFAECYHPWFNMYCTSFLLRNLEWDALPLNNALEDP